MDPDYRSGPRVIGSRFEIPQLGAAFGSVDYSSLPHGLGGCIPYANSCSILYVMAR